MVADISFQLHPVLPLMSHMKPPFAAQSQTPIWYDQHAYLLHVNTHRCSIQSANIPPESNALLGSLELGFF